MNNNASNVTVGKPKVGGSVYRAPLGTPVPTDATTPLDSAFENLGYISEDGVTNSNSPSVDQIKAWGGDVVKDLQTEKPDTFQMTFIEALNVNVLKTRYGDNNVTGSLETGLTIRANSEMLGESVWVFEMILNGNVLKRTVIPKGVVTETGDIVYQDGSAVGYDVKISAHPDSNGDTHYEYYKSAGTAYAVSFAPNGGTTVPVQYVAAGGKVIEPEDPERTGFEFAGWYADPEFTDEWVFADDTVNADTVLYARWTS